MSARDMMGILLLVAISSKSVAPDGRYPDEGTRFKLSVEGPDSAAAFLAMADLLTCGGEGMVKCPYSGCISSVILISFDRKEIGYGCSKGTWTVSRATGKSASI